MTICFLGLFVNGRYHTACRYSGPMVWNSASVTFLKICYCGRQWDLIWCNLVQWHFLPMLSSTCQKKVIISTLQAKQINVSNKVQNWPLAPPTKKDRASDGPNWVVIILLFLPRFQLNMSRALSSPLTAARASSLMSLWWNTTHSVNVPSL